MKIKPLPMRKAVDLYRLLRNHLPDKNEIDVDYIGYIINSINSSPDERGNYASAIVLMYGIDIKELANKYEAKEVLQLFMQGLIINKIVELDRFMKFLGVSDA